MLPEAYRPFFWIFAGVACCLAYFAMGYAKKYNTTAAFLLPPFICFCIAFDNIVMATTGIDESKVSTQAMLAFHACIIPMILLVCYEMAYLVHKQKSVNFCGIRFESGHRRAGRRNQAWAMCLRLTIWLLALGLLFLNLIASYGWVDEHLQDPARHMELKSVYDLQGDTTAHTLFSVIPAFVLVLLSMYIGMQLWNYGTFYSYMVHATCFNPWIWMLVGSIALLAGYLLPAPIYALSSNAGELLMMVSIVRMFREVHHDMQQGLQMRHFIDPIPTRSPQSVSMSHRSSHGGMVLDGSTGGTNGKYDASCGSPLGQPQATLAPSYIEVFTPKDSELHLTDADRHAQSSAFLSVVVSHSRTNPLFSSGGVSTASSSMGQ